MWISNRAENADLKILITDSSIHHKFLSDQCHVTRHMTPSLQAMTQQFLALDESDQSLQSEEAAGIFKADDTLVVLNKIDLVQGNVPSSFRAEGLQEMCEGAQVCVMSCKTGDGVDVFMGHLEKMLTRMYIIIIMMRL